MSAWSPTLDIAAPPFLEKNMVAAMLAHKARSRAEGLRAAWKLQMVSQTRPVLALETIALLREWVQVQGSSSARVSLQSHHMPYVSHLVGSKTNREVSDSGQSGVLLRIETTQHVGGQYQCICCLVNLGDLLLSAALRSPKTLKLLIHRLCSFKVTW